MTHEHVHLTSARAFALALAFFSAIATSAGASSSADARQIVLATVHGFRADALTPGDAPNLTDLAAHGARFTHAVTASPQSIPSLASIHTGRLPIGHGMSDAFTRPLGETVTLAAFLAAAGWRTAAFPADVQVHRRSGLDRGFRSFRHDAPGWTNAARVDSALAALEVGGTGNTFVWIGLTLAPPRLGWERYLGSGSLDRADYVQRVREVDAAIERLARGLRSRPGAVLVVTGTHGEHVPGLGDAGLFPHPRGAGFDLTEDALRVPLLIAGSGISPRIVDEWVTTCDIAPTITDLVHGTAMGGDGLSLAPTLEGERLVSRRIFHETDVSRLTGWPRRVAVRGPEGMLVAYGVHTLDVVMTKGGGAEPRTHGAPGSAVPSWDRDAAPLLEALRSVYGELTLTPAGAGSFEAENMPLVALIEALERGWSGDPLGARAAVESLAVAHPANGLLQIEHGRALAFARDESRAAFFFDDLCASRPALVEAETAYHELLRLFARHDVASARLEALDAGAMYEPERLWSQGVALSAGRHFGEARQVFAQAAALGAPPTPWFAKVRENTSALQEAHRTLELYGAGYDAHLELGRVLGELGFFHDAYPHFNQARGFKSFDPEPEYWLGYYLLRDGRPRHALVAFDRAIAHDAEHVPSLTQKATAHLRLGELDAAFDALEAAVRVGGTESDAHYNYACLLARRDRTEEALFQLEVAIVKGYANCERLENDPDLAPLRADPRFTEIIGRVPEC